MSFPVMTWRFLSVVFLFCSVCEGNGLMLNLERPTRNGIVTSRLRDRVRHARLLSVSVADFPVEGTFDPFTIGLYYTRVKLGTPPREFYVQIDTGSDVLWVSCNPCKGCPRSSGIEHIQLEFFDTTTSSTAAPISCSDQRCSFDTSDSGCMDQNRCGYTFQYGDGSGTSGYYVSDSIYFDSVVGSSLSSNNSAPVVFGCSTSQTGDLTKPDRAVDGIFGFGQQGLSVISQLASQGVTPNVFSHCLSGDRDGGGILVLGQIVEPNMVYTPLVPSQPHYNVNLQSIAVNGQILAISSTVFATSNNRGTIIDSGTTLAYFAEEAYDPLVSTITQMVSESVRPLVSKGNQCYLTTSSISEIFPQVNLNFAGGASMILRPQDYLLNQESVGEATVWCIGIQKVEGQSITILGDLVLKDKIVVYDLGRQRIGWANYDCSSSVNVSAANSNGETAYVNAGQVQKNMAAGCEPYKLISSIIVSILLHYLVFMIHMNFEAIGMSV